MTIKTTRDGFKAEAMDKQKIYNYKINYIFLTQKDKLNSINIDKVFYGLPNLIEDHLTKGGFILTKKLYRRNSMTNHNVDRNYYIQVTDSGRVNFL